MPENRHEWVVRDKRGRIYGPFNTDKVLDYIERGFFSGSEEIAKYPGGDWYSISREPEFYDRLLEALAGDGETKSNFPPPDLERTKEFDSHTKTPIEGQTPSRVLKGKVDLKEIETQGATRRTSTRTSRTRQRTHGGQTGVLDLENITQIIAEAGSHRLRLPVLILAIVGLIGGAFWWTRPRAQPSSDRIHLLAPRKNQTPISVAAMKMNLVKAIRAFQRDTFEGYSESQNELVQVVEANPRSLDALEFLCLTYRELWSYSFQDGADSQTVSQVTQMAATLDPLSPKGGACRVSQMMILGRLPEARSITDSILETFNNAEVFYQFRAEILAAKGDFATATAYTQRAQQMAPGWIKPYFSEAVYDEAQERFGEADRILRKILQMNPDHAQAKAELGKIQYRYFRNLDNGLALLQSAVSGTSRMTPQAEAHARLILAQIYLQRNEPRPALKEAQRCYTLSSTNAECRKIIVQLGGLEKLKNTRVEDREALFLGDEYVKNGDCFAAQAEYKAAFDADPKNALAAYKAGKCLWQLSYTSEALEWLQKAIQADPNLTEAYVALADYSVQRFNYDVASRTLAQIQRLRPNDYKVYLGYGLVEFRRKNYRASIKFAEKALELYNADVDVYVLLAKNYLDMRDFPEAQGYGARAIELDLNSVEAQALYGKILAGLRGSDAGLDYVRHLSSDYPNVIEYQIALVEILIGDEKYAEAKDVLERLAKTGDHKDVLLLLGSVYQKLQNSAGARQAYLNAATLDSGDAEALFRLGLLYLAAHQGPAATKQFSRVLDINSHYPGAHVNLGRAALEQGQTDKALEEATKEKQMNPLMADAYILAADVYEKNGQYTNCASEYQKAAKLRPENSLIYVHMAKCFRQSGSLDIALTMLKLAAKTESGNADIYKEEGALYEMKGDREAASAAYQRYLNLAPTAPDRAAIQMKIIN